MTILANRCTILQNYFYFTDPIVTFIEPGTPLSHPVTSILRRGRIVVMTIVVNDCQFLQNAGVEVFLGLSEISMAE
jgi:hypothetical protein